MVTEDHQEVLSIDRRRLLQCGLSASLLASLPMYGRSVDKGLSSELMRFVSDSGVVRHPDITGKLSDDECESLFSLCDFVDRVWEFEADMSTYKKVLQSDLGLKTRRHPSYLTEYQDAADLVSLVRRNSESDDEAWLTLLFAKTANDDIAATRLGRARHWVFSEFIAHQIPIAAAFKSFGFVNYRGFFGGPYKAQDSYRRAEF